MRKLLYYPTFLPPSPQWVKQSLLFWDVFSTIIPDSLYYQVANPDLDYLRGEGVFQPVSPNFFSPDGEEAGRELVRRLNVVLSTPGMKSKLQLTQESDTYRVSNLKIASGVLDVFENHGLEVRAADWSEDFEIKKPAAIAYLSLLADVMASTADIEPMQPGTDSQYAQSIAFEGGTSEGLRLVLDTALPMIREDVSCEDVLRFRTNRRPELLQFRAFIDKAEDSLASEDEADFARKLERFKDLLEKETIELQSLMDDSRISWRLGTLETLLGASAPGILSALATLQVTSNGPLALVSGGAISVARVLLTGRTQKRAIEKSPVSYLYAASEELG